MKAKDVMTSPVVSIEPDASIWQAVRIMLQRHISGLPVIDQKGALVGVVTEGDFLRRAETGTQRRRPRWLEYLIGPGRLADEYTRAHGRKVSEIMTADPLTISEDTLLDEIVRLMEKRQIKRLPVVRDQQVVGIVSRANLVHALASVARDIKPASAGDQAIRDRILAELASQSWAPVALVDVLVRDGVVELWGMITDERERKAIVVAAENAPGVKAVNDHLAWVDGTSGMVLYPSSEEPAQMKVS
jgi:CBS domain-containing protein